MYGALLTVLLSASAEPASATTIVRVVGGAERGAATTVAIERGVQRSVGWMVDVALDDAARRKVARRVRPCGEDDRCVADGLRAEGVDFGVYLVANLTVEPALVTVDLIDSRRAGSVARALVPAGRAPLEDRVVSSVRSVLRRAGFEPGGRLFIRVEPPRAQIRVVDAAGRAVDPLAVLSAGRYRVQADLPDHIPDSAEATVTPERTTSVTLLLEPERPVWSRWWFWTAAAVVVAGSAVAITVVATSPDDVAFCHPVPGGPC